MITLKNLLKRKGDIIKMLGEEIGLIVLNKLKTDINDLNNFSKVELNNVIFALCNYIDSNDDITYGDINNIPLNNIIPIWERWYNDYKEKYNTYNFTDKNKIVCDYRNNGIGYYWVDIGKLFCIESMIRMKDCGRVRYGNTTFELRESTDLNNISHIIIVFDLVKHTIVQIKGHSNKLPDKKYWNLIYDFIIEFPFEIMDYKPTFKPENDFKISMLPYEKQINLTKIHPNLKRYMSRIC
jgi:hypothetical protein